MSSRIYLSVLLSTSMLALAPTSFAQSSNTTPEADDDVIIVQARKRGESLQDVPLAVSVTGKTELERNQVIDLNDLARTTPALEVNQTFGGEQNGGGRLRGLGTGVFNRSVSPSVAYVVDQAPQGNLSFRTLFDLEQVEVLRGPQGTLFGQGASAGVINIRTVEPSLDGMTGDLSIDYSDKGTLGSESGRRIIDAALNVPLSESMAIRVAGQFRDEDGVQFNPFTDEDNSQKQFGIRGKLLWEMSPDWTMRTKVEYSEQEIDGRDFFGFDNVNPPAGAPASGGTQGGLAACGVTLDDLEDYSSLTCQDVYVQDDTAFGFTNTVDVNVSDNLSLTAVTSYRTLDVDITATNFSSQVFGIAARDENLAEESTQFSQELRLSYEQDNWDLIVGGFYNTYDFALSPLIDGPFGNTLPGQRIGFSLCVGDGVSDFGPPGLGPCIPGNGPTFVRTTTNNSILAGFIDGTFALNDQWDIFGGLRISDYENDTAVYVPNQPTVLDQSPSTGETNVSGRIGSRYQPDADTTIYGSVSLGYKPSAVAVTDLANERVINLEKEEALAFELGIKKGLGAHNLEANIFYSDLDNFQAQTNEFIGNEALTSVPRNIEEIVSYGIELSAFGELSDNLSYSAGYIYNSATYPDGFLGDGENFRLGSSPAVLEGEQVQFAPEHKATLSGEYSQTVGANLEGFINTNVVYKSKILLAQFAPDLTTYPGHFTFGGAIGLRSGDGNWAASIYARNLFAEREPVGYLGQPFPDGAVRSWPAPGITTRLVGAKLDFNF